MTVLDWVLLIVWLGFSLSGFWEGAVRIVFGAAGLIVGLWIAILMGADLATSLSQWITIDWLAAALGHLIPVLVAVALFGVAGWGIDRTLKAMRLGWLNRLSGALLAGAAAAILLGVGLVAVAGFSPAFADLCGESLFAPVLVEVSQQVFGAE